MDGVRRKKELYVAATEPRPRPISGGKIWKSSTPITFPTHTPNRSTFHSSTIHAITDHTVTTRPPPPLSVSLSL